MFYSDYDYSGYAIRYGIMQQDGTRVLKDAFASSAGQTVPLVYNYYKVGGSHIPDMSNENIAGYAYLKNREDGVYAYCTIYDEHVGLEKHIQSLTVFVRITERRERKILKGDILAVKIISK